MFSPQIRHFSLAFPMFFQDSGTLALDLAMTYASTETEAAKSCFGPYKVRSIAKHCEALGLEGAYLPPDLGWYVTSTDVFLCSHIF